MGSNLLLYQWLYECMAQEKLICILERELINIKQMKFTIRVKYCNIWVCQSIWENGIDNFAQVKLWAFRYPLIYIRNALKSKLYELYICDIHWAIWMALETNLHNIFWYISVPPSFWLHKAKIT